jgi:F-type H+-transporting ATPase subunit delta
MLAEQVAKKYSLALFNLVREHHLMDEAYQQFAELDLLVSKDKMLMEFLKAPHIPDQHKVDIVHHVFDTRLEPLFLEFILVLVHKYRIRFLHDIIIEFRALVAEAKNMVVAKVISSRPMTDDTRLKLIMQLQAKTGHIIELDETVDPAILGGMIVIIKDQIIDGSVRHQLGLLKEELMKAKVA